MKTQEKKICREGVKKKNQGKQEKKTMKTKTDINGGCFSRLLYPGRAEAGGALGCAGALLCPSSEKGKMQVITSQHTGLGWDIWENVLLAFCKVGLQKSKFGRQL